MEYRVFFQVLPQNTYNYFKDLLKQYNLLPNVKLLQSISVLKDLLVKIFFHETLVKKVNYILSLKAVY